MKDLKIKKQRFSCKRDGLTVRGTVFRPQGKALPAVIISHPFMGNQLMVRQYARMLAKMGYAAFAFDFCGGSVVLGRSDGKTTEMSVLTEVEDLLTVIDYVRGLDYIDSERITLMGCSQGGFVSAIAAVKRREQIEALILFYPALCIPDDARSGRMMLASFDPERIPERIRCGPMRLGGCYVADVVNMDAYAEISGYEGRVLIVHGDEDKIVAMDYARRAAECYGDSARLCVVEGGGHIFSGRKDQIAKGYLREFIEEVTEVRSKADEQ